MELDELITELGYFFLIVNTFLFILSFNKKDKALKYFILNLVLCSVVQLISSKLHDKGINNLYLSHYFFTGQFLLLSLFYSSLSGYEKIKKPIKYFSFTLTLSIILYFSLNSKAYVKWNELEIGLTSIPLLLYSFLFFLKKVDDNNDKIYIYFNSGFFVYTLCSTLIFILGNIGSREIKLIVWDINQILYLIFQILIFIEWYKNFRTQIFFKKK
ncbi:hypothetical protein [Polaribacter sp. Z022]|uniref:hypothetical protein n=1 Tax=Polaribacter sp. Z022 TaxID=2927125 RepID=UPI002022809B|nr:hypothetical protein [Polaribacter sp. Z022]MCL7755081.1 hypothetical protein [Polaribacter sp. Z022]